MWAAHWITFLCVFSWWVVILNLTGSVRFSFMDSTYMVELGEKLMCLQKLGVSWLYFKGKIKASSGVDTGVLSKSFGFQLHWGNVCRTLLSLAFCLTNAGHTQALNSQVLKSSQLCQFYFLMHHCENYLLNISPRGNFFSGVKKRGLVAMCSSVHNSGIIPLSPHTS